MKIFFLILMIFIVDGYANEKVLWPYISYPPIFIIEDGVVLGSGAALQDLLFKNIKGYKHIPIEMPINRVLDSAKKGKTLCIIGVHRTPSREKIFEFSIPHSLDTPPYLIYSKRVESFFLKYKEIDFKDIIKNKKLKFVVKKGISYGEYIDKILEKNKGQENIVFTQNAGLGDRELEMVLKERGDYTIGLISTKYFLRKMKLNKEFKSIPIKYHYDYESFHIGCTKNATGRKLIKEINLVLRKHIRTESYYSMMNFWVSKSEKRKHDIYYRHFLIDSYK